MAGARRARDEQHIHTVERVIAELLDDSLPSRDDHEGQTEQLSFLYYALGKEYEDLENWDAAFSAFERGAQCKRSLLDYDEAEETRFFEALHRLPSAPGSGL